MTEALFVAVILFLGCLCYIIDIYWDFQKLNTSILEEARDLLKILIDRQAQKKLTFPEIRKIAAEGGMTTESFKRAFELLFLTGGAYKALWVDWEQDGDSQHQVFWLGDAQQTWLQLRHDENNRKKKLEEFRTKNARVLAVIGWFKTI